MITEAWIFWRFEMRIPRIILVSICLTGVFAVAAAFLSNRPWRSAKDVQDYIVRQTPQGSSLEDVRELIRRERWGVCLDFQGNTSTSRDYTHTGVVGFHILGAKLPDYGFPFRIHTEAYWGFDVNEKLIDIHVRSWSEGM